MIEQHLTNKELGALHHIRNWVVNNGRAPSVRELMRDMNYKSPRSAQKILDSLLEKEIITRNQFGDIQLNDKPTWNKSHAQTINVPLLGTVSCGSPILAEENIEAMIPVSVNVANPQSKYFLLRTTGNSMDLAGIQDGELVLVQQQQYAENGDKVVALIDDEAVVKEFHKERENIILKPKSSDKSHQAIILSDEFEIQGVVKTVIPNL